MLIKKTNNTNCQLRRSPSFCAGKTTLYTDFDGTLLPTSIKPLYNGSQSEKEQTIKGLNHYFSSFNSLISESKDNFKLNITTGRRAGAEGSSEGFYDAYNQMKNSGIIFPKVNEIITTEGGDIYHTNAKGNIINEFDSEKAKNIEELSGWSYTKLKAITEDIFKKNNAAFGFTNTDKGNFRLELITKGSDSNKIKKELSEELEKQKISAKVYGDNGDIKLKPVVMGHSLSKDFDVKMALKRAHQNNDFVIAAGDDKNDLKMLNIFRYIDMPEGVKEPSKAEDIAPMIKKFPEIKTKIEKLPLKLVLVKSEHNKISNKYPFFEEIASNFPNNFKIIEKSHIGENNFFADEVKHSIKTYAQKDKIFMNALKNDATNFLKYLGISFPPKRNFSKSKIALITLPLVSLMSLAAYKLLNNKKNKSAQRNAVVASMPINKVEYKAKTIEKRA